MTTYADLDRIDAKYALYKRAKERRAELAYGFVAREFPGIVEGDRATRFATLILIGLLLLAVLIGVLLLFRVEPILAAAAALVLLACAGVPGWYEALVTEIAKRIPKKDLPERDRAFALAYAWVDTQENYRRYGAIVRAWECEDGRRHGAWPSASVR